MRADHQRSASVLYTNSTNTHRMLNTDCALTGHSPAHMIRSARLYSWWVTPMLPSKCRLHTQYTCVSLHMRITDTRIIACSSFILSSTRRPCLLISSDFMSSWIGWSNDVCRHSPSFRECLGIVFLRESTSNRFASKCPSISPSMITNQGWSTAENELGMTWLGAR